MLVSEAISLLQVAELKQLKVGEDTAAIIGYINLGILEIHKKFPILELDATITQIAGKSIYTLSSSDNDVSIDLTTNEVLSIERAYDEVDLRYVINNEKDSASLSTPTYNKIKVATVVPGYKINIVYRATPKFLTVATDIIPLPLQFIEALFLYVGYKSHVSIKSGIKDENNTYYVRFDASCKKIKSEGLFQQYDLISTKFINRGFV